MFSNIVQSTSTAFSSSSSSNMNHKQQQLQRRHMNASVLSAAEQPSTSANPRYNSLLALQSRDFRSAPGSKLVLSDIGGLLAGSGKDDRPFSIGMQKSFHTKMDQYLKEKDNKSVSSVSSRGSGITLKEVNEDRASWIKERMEDA
ncbi:MAG: hypothetical protein P8104_07270, partial [Gammaproteobacteria bacterium]